MPLCVIIKMASIGRSVRLDRLVLAEVEAVKRKCRQKNRDGSFRNSVPGGGSQVPHNGYFTEHSAVEGLVQSDM